MEIFATIVLLYWANAKSLYNRLEFYRIEWNVMFLDFLF